MYNPYPFDDPRSVNRPALPQKTVESVIAGGSRNAAKKFAGMLAETLSREGRSLAVAFDGYTAASWDKFINLLHSELEALGIPLRVIDGHKAVFKSNDEINSMIEPLLSWDTSEDPTLLFGRIYRGGYEGMTDEEKVGALRKDLGSLVRGTGEVVLVYGYGVLSKGLRDLFDVKCFFDITPKTSILRIRRGEYANIGKEYADPVNRIIRRCYYCDFEMAVQERRELLQSDSIDWLFLSDDPDDVKILSRETFSDILSRLATYPFRAKPVYLEGVWGGTYMKKLRNLPPQMRNAAWVFDFIPMEVSVVVEAGHNLLEFNFCTFVHKEGEAIMGDACVRKFGGYFPIRFNYDDSYHSTGNMSIQCHSGAKFNIDRYDELGRQDESYYVCVTGHEAKTFIGFRDDADIDEFFRAIEAADKDCKPVDYMKYVSYEESRPGLQVMLPAGTIHSSGRNQVILEIGSLTVGSYTYKMYDYLRLDFDGKQRPIHTRLGELNVRQDRRTSVIRDPDSPEYIVQKPRVLKDGDGWREIILGENPQMYIALHRLDFERFCPQDTEGNRFHVLALVDGEGVRVRSLDHPERSFEMQFLDIVCVPACMGKYVIENLGKEPVMVHKTLLRDGYENDPR